MLKIDDSNNSRGSFKNSLINNPLFFKKLNSILPFTRFNFELKKNRFSEIINSRKVRFKIKNL